MSNQRRFPRIPAHNVVLVTKVEGEELDSFVKTSSVGMGGCGFVSDKRLGVGSVIELMISVRPRVVKAQGRVVHENPRDDGKTLIGIEFIDLDPADRQVIEQLLETDDELTT